jgi:hypothetical protein
LVEAGIEQQACLGLYRFHEADSEGFPTIAVRGFLLHRTCPGRFSEKLGLKSRP